MAVIALGVYMMTLICLSLLLQQVTISSHIKRLELRIAELERKYGIKPVEVQEN